MATSRALSWILSLALLSMAEPGRGEMLTFSTAASWARWKMPAGLVSVDAQGRLRLAQFRKDIDAVTDAHLFSHPTQERGIVRGGIWAAGSRATSAARIIDGDPGTWWQPDPDAQLEDWSVDIDLGRAVLAREIRLHFPDREGARPFRQFTVYATTGARIKPTEDEFRFYPVYRTTRPNSATEISIPLEYAGTDTVVLLDAGMDVDGERESRFQVVQYLSIVADAKSEDAALAEVEVLAVGDNISQGTLERGTLVNGTVVGTPQNLFDGDMNTFAIVTSGHEDEGGDRIDWKGAGTWWGVDLGAVFFIDDLFLYYQNRGEGVSSFIWFYSSSGPGHRILYSDGHQSISTTLPLPEALDYDELVTHIDPRADNLYQIRYLFQPRRIRYLFWHGTTHLNWRESRTLELMLFSPGYPAQVVLTSDFIDLGTLDGDGRPRAIKALHWDADLPPGTRLQLRSRSGSELRQVFTFYDKKGDQVTEQKWNSLPKVVKGPVDTAMVIGEDWDAWSNVYHASGEAFQSRSPRRFVQLELILSTDDPQVAPSLRSLSLEYEQALLQEARGRIAPIQARPAEDTRFTYTLWPRSGSGDAGFDVLRFAVPYPVDPEAVEIRIGGQQVTPTSVAMHGDSLLISLPRPVDSDSLETRFTTRVLENATVFSLDLGLSQRPGLWQSVEPVSRRANVVMLPALTHSEQLIAHLQVEPATFTPNGDGINEQVEIRFAVYKVADARPRARIYDLQGRLVASPQSQSAGSQQRFVWDGRSSSGERVPPGLYLLHLDLGAESGQDTALRLLSVAY